MEYYKNYSSADIDGEIWEDCLGYDGIYSVSNLGRIKSERRNRIMKQQVVMSNFHNLKEPSKSLRVSFSVNKKKATFNISTLVGCAFIGECKENECYSKKNKKWDDLRADNLEIKTISESISIAYEKGNNLKKKKCLIKNHKSKFYWIRKLDGKKFLSEDLKKEYGYEVRPNIRRSMKRNKKSYNSFWERVEVENNIQIKQ